MTIVEENARSGFISPGESSLEVFLLEVLFFFKRKKYQNHCFCTHYADRFNKVNISCEDFFFFTSRECAGFSHLMTICDELRLVSLVFYF